VCVLFCGEEGINEHAICLTYLLALSLGSKECFVLKKIK